MAHDAHHALSFSYRLSRANLYLAIGKERLVRHRPFGPDLPERPKVSEIGLGTWQLGAGWGRVAEKDALAALHAAADAGMTFIDTADVYGYGRSETLIGRFLRERPGERFFIASKAGLARPLDEPGQFTLDNLRRCVLGSLERLGLSRLDLLQLHAIPREILYDGEALSILAALRDEGLARFAGASVKTLDEAFFCLERGVDSLQIIFNVFRQEAADGLLRAAMETGTAIVVRTPLASGLLAGKLSLATTFAKTDHRRFNRDGRYFHVGETFSGLPFEKGLELVERLRQMRPKGLTLAQMSLRFILDHPAVTVVIAGARNARQAAANASASDLAPLPPRTMDRLRAFYRDEVSAHVRGER